MRGLAVPYRPARIACVLAVAAATAWRGLAGEVPPSQAEGAAQLLEQGRYAEAEASAREALDQAERSHGGGSVEAADALRILVRARAQGGKAGDDETLALAQRELAVREGVVGSQHPEFGASLDWMGVLLNMRGALAEAGPFYERGLTVREAALGPDHTDVAKSLVHVSFSLSNRGDSEGARRLLERALGIHEHAQGPEHLDVARTASNLALVLDDTGDYAEARELLERAAAIWSVQGGSEHPQFGAVLHNLARACWRLGDYESARSHAARALTVKEKALGRAHPSLAFTTGLLAELVGYEGDFVEARRLQEGSIEIIERAYGSEHPELATSLGNLANWMAALGDHQAARERLERALAIRRRAYPAGHPLVAEVLEALARLELRSGRPEPAGHLLEQALAIREQSGPDHPGVAVALDGLGDLGRGGDVAAPRRLFERSLEIRERALGPTHPLLARSLDRLALAAIVEGRLAEARAAAERAVRLREAAFGADYPEVAEARGTLARVLGLQGEIGPALDAALEAERVAREHLRLTIRHLSERHALLYAAARPSGLNLALSLLAEGSPEALARQGDVFDALIRSRALVLDEMAARHRGAATASEAGDAARAVTEARQRLARLVVRGPADEPPERYRRLLDAARDEKERAEEALARTLAERSRPALERPHEQIRRALPEGTALVAYVRYERSAAPPRRTAAPGGEAAGGEAAYLAFVLRGEQLGVAPLGSAARIDSLVDAWRAALLQEAAAPAMGRKHRLLAHHRAAARLRRAIWDPVSSRLGGAAAAYVVADGPLHVVSLAALPDRSGRFLVETGPLLLPLGAERDLLRTREPPTGRGLLALGGAAFDQRSEGPPRRTASFRGAADCEGFRSLRFTPLEFSGSEANEVAALWRAHNGEGATAVTLRGAAASEARFKAEAGSRRALHLATHGFFLGSDCTSPTPETPAGGGPALRGEVAESAFLRTGLALSGANRRHEAGPDEEDGILTAEEVSALDLSEVESAVLSACGTGLGDIQAGEGVLGLTRAFQLAGVRSVVVSLWPVADEASRDWMRLFYRHRLASRSTAAEASARASRDLLQLRRGRGQPEHPFYWAAFVAIGAERTVP